MKKAFPYILFFLLLGCQSSIEKGQIQGSWYRFESPNGFTAIEFKENGSFTANSTFYSDKGQWDIDGNQILLKDTIGGNHVSLKFRLLEEKEMVIEKKGDEDWGIELTIAPDFVKFFEDLNNVELRDDLSFGTSLEAWRNSFNIYLVSEDDGVLFQLDEK
ncbi:hypothetical protein ACOKFD_11685 [Flagellimonas sp. S174]|uniref:hypothetical protein n=1 Tax=Flagellimonas sp. S174 TaxID=3410790 RepID=UPI003BF4E964